MFEWKHSVEKNRIKAVKLGLRTKPYDIADVKVMSDDQVLKIRKSLDSVINGEWDEQEFAFFESPAMVRLLIENRRIQEKPLFSLLSSQEQLLRFRENRLDGFKETVDELKQKYTCDWRTAQKRGLLDNYFSGVELYDKIFKRTPYELYNDDYSDYIKTLTAEQYIDLLVKLRLPSQPENFDDPRTFIDVGLSQVAVYTEIIKQIPVTEKIQIVGDGIGIASYVCRMMNRLYTSFEPNPIGDVAREISLITKQDDDFDPACVVFFGNVINYLTESQISRILLLPKVVIWDEKPSYLIDVKNGGDFRLWYRGITVIIMDSGKYRYIPFLKSQMLKNEVYPLDVVSDAIITSLRQSLISRGATGPGLCSRKDKKKPKVKKFYVCVEFAAARRHIKGAKSCVYHLPTNSYVTSSQAHSGQVKNYEGHLIEWYEGRKYLLDTYYGPLSYDKYSSVVLSQAQLIEEGIYKAEGVPNPSRIRMIRDVDQLIRVVFIRTDYDGFSYFQSASFYCYKDTYK